MLDLMYQRRTTRKYQDKPVEKEKVEKLVKSALLAPSARSIFPQRYIVVDDKEILQKLAPAKGPGSAFLKNAPLALVILGDESESDVWIEDTCISATFVMLMAESLGLSSCWIQLRKRQYDPNTTSEEYVRSLLNIPENVKVECILSLGYPEGKKPPHTDEELNFENVHLNNYQNPYKS